MFKNAFFLLVIVISCGSCEKLMDYYNYKEREAIPACRVNTITNTTDSEIYTTRIFYNNAGLPVAVKYETYNRELDFIDSFSFYYAYDQVNRLISETSEFVYGPNLVYYAYEGNSKLPVRDSVVALYSSWVEDLEYDVIGRLIKKTARNFQFIIPEDNPGPHPDIVHRYYYDVRGNRQEHVSNPGYSGLVQYTDNPSLYSLHPVWQLTHKNYSRNSVAFAETYNDKGLPLIMKDDIVPNPQPFLNLSASSVVDYDCE